MSLPRAYARDCGFRLVEDEHPAAEKLLRLGAKFEPLPQANTD